MWLFFQKKPETRDFVHLFLEIKKMTGLVEKSEVLNYYRVQILEPRGELPIVYFFISSD